MVIEFLNFMKILEISDEKNKIGGQELIKSCRNIGKKLQKVVNK